MSTANTAAIVVIVAVVIVIAVIAGLVMNRRRRSQRLREQFGPEYDRALQSSGSRPKAEAELQQRRQRREQMDIRDLDPQARERYRRSWQDVQAQFVDAPSQAVREADRLVAQVMEDRGYPVHDFDQRAADLSVDHSEVVEHYRAAHEISRANSENRASTEDLRLAMQHYRALFEDLLGDREQREPDRERPEARREPDRERSEERRDR